MATDLVNEQLRKAFITINAKAEKDAQSKKKKRRKLSSKDRAKAAERAAQSAAEWEQAQKTRPCRECGKPAKADPVFFLNPVMCQRCKDQAHDIDLGIHPCKHEDFSEITVFKGGSPGLGKRK